MIIIILVGSILAKRCTCMLGRVQGGQFRRKKHDNWRNVNKDLVLEKILESPLDCKEIQPVHPKGDQSWVFFGRTDAEAETPTLWPLHAKR